MKKSLLAALLVLCGLIVAQTTARKAVVTTHEGAVQEVTIVDESMDSIKVMLLGNTISMPKDKIKSITYPEIQPSLIRMDQKLDTLITLQKNHIEDQKYNPLKSRNYGIEISTLGLLSIGQSSGFMSVGVSSFKLDRNAEIVMPITWSWMNDWSDKSAVTVDLQYRKFLGFFDNIQNGLYLSALLSYAHTQGYREEWDNSYPYHNYKTKKYNYDMFGFGFGLGYRRFSVSGWYWGTGLVFGRYLNADDKIHVEGMASGRVISEYFFDFEILKFGWAF